MQENKQLLLIDYLDRSLEGEELAAAEQLLRGDDKEIAEYWNNLLLAKEAIEYAGLYDQVANIREQYTQMSTGKVVPMQRASVRSLTAKVFRIAAVFVLVLGAAIVYKFVATSPAGFYKDNYAAYDMNTSRGGNEIDQVERSYRAKDWANVITIFNATRVKSNKAWFLAGIAGMELKKYNEAAAKFEHIIATNTMSGEAYFQDEAEYYLAMTYLTDNQTDKAMVLFSQIKADKAHLYHRKVAEMSWIDLKILSAKE